MWAISALTYPLFNSFFPFIIIPECVDHIVTIFAEIKWVDSSFSVAITSNKCDIAGKLIPQEFLIHYHFL